MMHGELATKGIWLIIKTSDNTSNQRHLVDNQRHLVDNHLLIYGFSCNESQRLVVVDKSSSSIGGKLTTGVVLSHLPRQELCGEYVKFLFIRR